MTRVNERRMIRQYVLLAIVIIIALFVATQIEWNNTPAGNLDQAGASLSVEAEEKAKITEPEVSFSDLRTGGVTRPKRRQKPDADLSPPVKRVLTGAATSSPFTATSTPFQTKRGAQTSYSGVNVTFSKGVKS
jgi:hypothetical protein